MYPLFIYMNGWWKYLCSCNTFPDWIVHLYFIHLHYRILEVFGVSTICFMLSNVYLEYEQDNQDIGFFYWRVIVH